MRHIAILLDNIRSVHNVGSIFRTADAMGVSKIYCLGTTPLPVDRFGRKRKDFTKVALGAEDAVLWQSISDASEFLRILMREGWKVVSVEQDKRSMNLKEVNKVTINAEKVLLVFGNEVDGVSSAILNLSDYIAEIPMRGKKESLNVSVTAGIALYTFCIYGDNVMLS